METQVVAVTIDHILSGMKPGEDGVIGEAMDVVNCMIDLIYQIKPDVTEEELAAIQERKCAKWVAKYG